MVVASGARAQKHLAAKNTSRKYRTDWQSCRPAPEGCAPTPEWKDQFMKDFSASRASLKQFKHSQERQAKRTGGSKSKQDKSKEQEVNEIDEQQHNIPELDSTQPPSPTYSKSAATGRPVVIPKMHDEQKWRTLLYGSTPSPSTLISHVASTTTVVATEATALSTPSPSSIANATPTTIATASTTTTRPAPMPTGAIRQEGMSPSPQFLIRLDQGHLIQLLKYHLRWLAEDDLQEQEVP